MKSFKKLLTILLALLMVLVMAGCSEETGKGTEEDDQVIMYMIGGMPGGPAWGPAKTGFELACEELGWKGTYLAPTTAANQIEIAELLTTAVTNGADVVLGLMYDEEMFSDVVKEYVEQGIVILGANVSVEESNAKIGADATEKGRLFAEGVLKTIPEGEHIYSVTMTTTFSTAINESVDAYKAALIEARGEENVTVYDILECKSDTSLAYTNFGAFYLAHPECNVFISENSYAALGIASYIQEYNLQDKICALGIDDSEEILQAVKDGYLDGTVSQNFYNIGYGGVYLAKKILDGEEYEWNNSSGTTLLWPEDVEAWAEKLGYTIK
jgi:ABC-type sugar transport system substrate-binding protein